MSDKDYILSIDQGTTGSTALLFDKKGRVVSHSYREIQQIYPRSGWVEHDPLEIITSCVSIAEEAVQKAGIPYSMVRGLSIYRNLETCTKT